MDADADTDRATDAAAGAEGEAGAVIAPVVEAVPAGAEDKVVEAAQPVFETREEQGWGPRVARVLT